MSARSAILCHCTNTIAAVTNPTLKTTPRSLSRSQCEYCILYGCELCPSAGR